MAAFKIITLGSNEANDLQDVLKKRIEKGKEELTTVDMPQEDTLLLRGKILGWRELLTDLVQPKSEDQPRIDDPTHTRSYDGPGF